LLLNRLKQAGHTIEKIILHPAKGPEGSELSSSRYDFPISLAGVTDIVALRKAISESQRRTDRLPGARGRGNPNKRIRIYLKEPAEGTVEGLATGLAGTRAPRYWALFASPSVYRIDDAVTELRQDVWTTSGKDIRAGDQVLVWRGKGDGSFDRGVVSFGEVLTDPAFLDDSGNPYWVEAPAPGATRPAVTVRYVRALNLPLLETEHSDLLSKLAVARARGGTVFAIAPGEWEAVLSAAGPLEPTIDTEDALDTLADEKDPIPKAGRVSRGQGIGLTQAEKKAVEDRAVTVAKAHYEAAGWTVELRGKPYDLHCTKPSGELRVEVKGTTGRGETIRLTRGEVEHARNKFPAVALFIVCKIKLDRGSRPVATGGQPGILDPWRIDEGALSALAFEYSVPASMKWGVNGEG
jgi:hypothetical protein